MEDLSQYESRLPAQKVRRNSPPSPLGDTPLQSPALSQFTPACHLALNLMLMWCLTILFPCTLASLRAGLQEIIVITKSRQNSYYVVAHTVTSSVLERKL